MIRFKCTITINQLNTDFQTCQMQYLASCTHIKFFFLSNCTHIKLCLCEMTPYQTTDTFLGQTKPTDPMVSPTRKTKIVSSDIVDSSLLYLVITIQILWQKQIHCSTSQPAEAAIQLAAANLSSSITSSLKYNRKKKITLTCLLPEFSMNKNNHASEVHFLHNNTTLCQIDINNHQRLMKMN